MFTEMLPIFVTKVLSMPWLEEVIMIMITACVFIATHFSIYSTKKVVAKKKEVPDDEPRREVPTRHVRDACQAPATFVEIPGVTDSRFNGVIVSFKAQDGYGFIQCPELFDKFKRDIFLHKAQVCNFGIGSKVSFGVFISKAGQPQAKKLLPWNPTQAELESFQAEQRQALPWSQRQAATPTELRWRTRASATQSASRGRNPEQATHGTWRDQDQAEVASTMPSTCRLPKPTLGSMEDIASPESGIKVKSSLNPNAKPFVLGTDYIADTTPQLNTGWSAEPGSRKWGRTRCNEYGYESHQAASARSWTSWPPEYPYAEGEADLQAGWHAVPTHKTPKWTLKETVTKKPYWRPVASVAENTEELINKTDEPKAE